MSVTDLPSDGRVVDDMAMFEIEPGAAHPPGVTVRPDGVNFSLFSQNATEVVLLLFDAADAVAAASRSSGSIRSATRHFISGTSSFAAAAPGSSTPFASTDPRIRPPATGSTRTRCSSSPVRARHLQGAVETGRRDRRRRTTSPRSMRCAIVDPDALRLGRRPAARTGRCTKRSSTRCTSAASRDRPAPASVQPGTFAGMIEKIPYLQSLGVTAVELLPVFDFDDTTSARNPAGDMIRNYWGYSTDRLLQPALRLLRRPQRSPRQRVPRSGEGAAPRRHRGHPRRRLQPHRRRQRARADALVPRHRQPDVLPARSEQPAPCT